MRCLYCDTDCLEHPGHPGALVERGRDGRLYPHDCSIHECVCGEAVVDRGRRRWDWEGGEPHACAWFAQGRTRAPQLWPALEEACPMVSDCREPPRPMPSAPRAAAPMIAAPTRQQSRPEPPTARRAPRFGGGVDV